MNKIIFKNNILNLIVGIILIASSLLAYFLGWLDSFLAIILGIILILLSLKRFLYTYHKLVSKKATLLLAFELLLDVVFSAIIIIFKSHLAVYIGLIIYIRGFTYLVINYVVKRKVIFYQYLINIGFITLGSFFIFTGIDLITYLVDMSAIFLLIIGVIYTLFGISNLIEKRKKTKPASPQPVINIKPATQPVVKKVEPETVVEKQPATKPKTEPVQGINYASMTVKELQDLAKSKNLSGYSKLSKSELIELLKKK